MEQVSRALTHGSTDDGLDRSDVQMFAQHLQLQTCAISDGNRRKIYSIGTTRLWIDRGRTCTSVAGAQHIAADDEVLGSIKWLSGTQKASPPLVQSRIAR